MKPSKKIIIASAAILLLTAAAIAGVWYYAKIKKSQPSEEPIIAGTQPHPEAKFSAIEIGMVTPEEYQRYTEALAALEKMPGDKGALINLGYIFKKIGRLEDAQLAFTILATWDEIEPDPEGSLGLARVYEDQKKYRDAEETYYKILKTFPLYQQAYLGLLGLYESNRLPPDPVFLTYIGKSRDFDSKNEYEQDLNSYVDRFTRLQNQ